MFGKFKRDAVRILISSIGGAFALNFGLMGQHIGFFNNVVAGVVLYVVSWVIAALLVRR